MSPGGSWPGSAATRGPPVLSFYPYGLLLLLLCKHCSSSTTWISSFMIACPRQSMGREDKNKRSLREGRRPYRVGWNACIFGARWTVHFYLYFSPPGSPFLSSILCVFPDPHSMILCCLPYEGSTQTRHSGLLTLKNHSLSFPGNYLSYVIWENRCYLWIKEHE